MIEKSRSLDAYVVHVHALDKVHGYCLQICGCMWELIINNFIYSENTANPKLVCKANERKLAFCDATESGKIGHGFAFPGK